LADGGRTTGRGIVKDDYSPETVAADISASRLAGDAASVAYRRERDTLARGNLADLLCEAYGVDPAGAAPDSPLVKMTAREFDALCDMLGLRTHLPPPVVRRRLR
jgi:hypothetical protein